jgi:hypothetical protein
MRWLYLLMYTTLADGFGSRRVRCAAADTVGEAAAMMTGTRLARDIE